MTRGSVHRGIGGLSDGVALSGARNWGSNYGRLLLDLFPAALRRRLWVVRPIY